VQLPRHEREIASGRGPPSGSGRAPDPSGVDPEGGIRALLCRGGLPARWGNNVGTPLTSARAIAPDTAATRLYAAPLRSALEAFVRA
jgi:hypothetical protein